MATGIAETTVTVTCTYLLILEVEGIHKNIDSQKKHSYICSIDLPSLFCAGASFSLPPGAVCPGVDDGLLF
jgi:hypothetical protein